MVVATSIHGGGRKTAAAIEAAAVVYCLNRTGLALEDKLQRKLENALSSDSADGACLVRLLDLRE